MPVRPMNSTGMRGSIAIIGSPTFGAQSITRSIRRGQLSIQRPNQRDARKEPRSSSLCDPKGTQIKHSSIILPFHQVASAFQKTLLDRGKKINARTHSVIYRGILLHGRWKGATKASSQQVVIATKVMARNSVTSGSTLKLDSPLGRLRPIARLLANLECTAKRRRIDYVMSQAFCAVELKPKLRLFPYIGCLASMVNYFAASRGGNQP